MYSVPILLSVWYFWSWLEMILNKSYKCARAVICEKLELAGCWIYGIFTILVLLQYLWCKRRCLFSLLIRDTSLDVKFLWWATLPWSVILLITCSFTSCLITWRQLEINYLMLKLNFCWIQKRGERSCSRQDGAGTTCKIRWWFKI